MAPVSGTISTTENPKLQVGQQNEFYFATFWVYRPTGISHILRSTKAFNIPHCDVVYDPKRNWFKITCPSNDVVTFQKRFCTLLLNPEEELEWDDVVTPDGSFKAEVEDGMILSVRESFTRQLAHVKHHEIPEENQLPDQFKKFEFTGVWKDIDENEPEHVNINTIISSSQFVQLGKSVGVLLSYDLAGRVVYVGGRSRDSVDTVMRKLTALLRSSRLEPLEIRHLFYSEGHSQHDHQIDARYMSAINPTLVTSTILDPNSHDLGKAYTAVSNAASLRICTLEPGTASFRSLFGPRARAAFKLDEARRYFEPFKSWKYKEKKSVLKVSRVVPQSLSKNASAGNAEIQTAEAGAMNRNSSVHVDWWLGTVPDKCATPDFARDPSPMNSNRGSTPHPSSEPEPLEQAAAVVRAPDSERPSLEERKRLQEELEKSMNVVPPAAEAYRPDQHQAQSASQPAASRGLKNQVSQIPQVPQAARVPLAQSQPTVSPPRRLHDINPAPGARIATSHVQEVDNLISFDDELPVQTDLLGFPMTRSAVQEDDDPSTRTFFQTSRQKAPSRQVGGTGSDPQPGLVRAMTESLLQLVGHLRFMPGRAGLRVQFGRICLKDFTASGMAKNTKDQWSNGWRPDELVVRINQHYSAPNKFIFAKALSIYGQDADSLATYPRPGPIAARMWGPLERQVSFDFDCRRDFLDSERGLEAMEAFVVEIDGKDFAYTLHQAKECLPPILMHCLHRQWDFQFVATHSPTASLEGVYSGFARSLVDSLEIPPNTHGSPVLYFEIDPETKSDDGDLFMTRVKGVRVRHTARYKSFDNKTYLDITQVQDMTVKATERKRLEYQRFLASPSKENPSDGVFGTWFEASLSSVNGEDFFKANEALGVGGEAPWTVEDIKTNGCLEALWKPAMAMIRQMDRVGVQTENGLAVEEDVVPKANARRDRDTNPGFW